MLNLKTLKLKNIGRFIDEQTIDFSNLNGLIQVDAQNLNTGGSSGSGKTTIFLALEYLLGINDTPVTILQSRLTKEALSVEGEFDLDGQDVTIRRSKKGLYIKHGAEETEGSSKLSEEKLDKILGMSRDLFRVLTHKRQKEGGFFLNFGPKETHAFLVDAKGLNEHTKKAEEIDKDLKKLEEELLQTQNFHTSAKSGLESTLNALASIGEPPASSPVTEEALSVFKTVQIEAESLKLATEQKHHKEKIELAKEKPNLSVTAFDRSKIVQLESDINSLVQKVNDLEKTERNRQSNAKDRLTDVQIKAAGVKSNIKNGEKAKLEAQRIVSELNKLKEGQCPTCEQVWITESKKVKEQQLLQSFETQKLLIVSGMEAEKEIKALEDMAIDISMELTPRIIPELTNINIQSQALKFTLTEERKLETEHNSKENQAIKHANDLYLKKVNLLSATQASELSIVKDSLSNAQFELSAAKQVFDSAKVALDRYNTTLNSLNAQKTKKESEVNNAENAVKTIKDKLDIVSEAKALVKSFISCSFDDALESIGDKATTIIRGVPNMATATVQLEGCRETKDGKIKEEVTAVIHMDGEQAVPIKSLSGGERSAVDLAIDLAVIDFLEDATGKGGNFYILDEPFVGLDSVSIEQVLEVLQSSNISKKLMIVDHNDVIKQFVQDKILVTRNGETSTVEVVQ